MYMYNVKCICIICIKINLSDNSTQLLNSGGTIHERSWYIVPNSVFLTMGPVLLYNICPGQEVILTQNH